MKRSGRNLLIAAIAVIITTVTLQVFDIVDIRKFGDTLNSGLESVLATPGDKGNSSGTEGQTGTPSPSTQPDVPTKTPDFSQTDGDQPVSNTDKGQATAKPPAKPSAKPPAGAGQSAGSEDGMAVVAQPESISALVNKQNKLPEDYSPADLVFPDVLFTFSEKIDKRKLRKEAAEALEQLFAGAEKDQVYLAGVSAYRSHNTQKSLFERYVKRDGLEKARTYSAYPGTSEHETGLAIDVTGSDGKCAAADCFGGTAEANWLAKHAYEYGFIIRYPKGKEEITGYQYEPWHLRYVGTDIAADIQESGETLEEYFDAVPVTG